ncbi:prefoldin, alpha subunit [Sphaeroforma arctica JP610]|uniref:Prefoldin, alpha subunit n=1 Tax=Sphaeroforma arctica JP610 TaxID=667725 RepID=A0A0L0FYF5_9EUKA|nr:prefoldin, alpha subunit [Sphaeroforma arctica JP610]KNC81571.1 prefoldin, alpha subunit [Sphaeroforma arctica JP610]|eukprot:XP_014155473.1 prefoldin, alpha subunit [Sphaeroforma arctica JP610]
MPPADGARPEFDPETVHRYENFIDKQLREDLRKLLVERDKVYEQMSDHYKLRNSIETIKESRQIELKTLVDIGQNIYCNARVPNCSELFVDIGFGFQLEMTVEEADAYIEEKLALLQLKADAITEKANGVRANIKTVLRALQELQLAIDLRD